MSRLALMFLSAAICFADGVKKEKPQASPTPDISEMPADIHAPLFRPPQRPQAGVVTERLTAGLPKQASSSAIARRNFIDDRVFGRMERDNIPHAPLATDQEFSAASRWI